MIWAKSRIGMFFMRNIFKFYLLMTLAQWICHWNFVHQKPWIFLFFTRNVDQIMNDNLVLLSLNLLQEEEFPHPNSIIFLKVNKIMYGQTLSNLENSNCNGLQISFSKLQQFIIQFVLQYFFPKRLGFNCWYYSWSSFY